MFVCARACERRGGGIQFPSYGRGTKIFPDHMSKGMQHSLGCEEPHSSNFDRAGARTHSAAMIYMTAFIK